MVKAQTITVVTEHAPPLSYLKNDQIVGAATEIIEMVLENENINYHISLYPWARAYSMAFKENVLIYPISRTVEREKLFKWVGSVYEIQYYFFKLKKRKGIKVFNLEDAKKYQIGVVRKDVRYQYLLRKR